MLSVADWREKMKEMFSEIDIMDESEKTIEMSRLMSLNSVINRAGKIFWIPKLFKSCYG
ncbi:MAG: hypothetical protein K9L23_12670 [Desulfotignum sp.]|nr:hypothetical protein [Desulfotignum sp.]